MKYSSYIICGLLIATGCSNKVDNNKFENLYRAAKSIEGATMTGVNCIKFGDFLQQYATEMLIVKDKPRNAKEDILLERYQAIYDIYSDSYTLWSYRTQLFANISSERLQAQYDQRWKYCIDKYGVARKPGGLNISDVLPVIWEKASLLIKGLNSDM